MDKELKRCPCCGSTQLETQTDSAIFFGQIYSERYPEKVANQDNGYRVRCICGLQTCWWHYEQEAIDKWNARSERSEPSIPVEAFEELLKEAMNLYNAYPNYRSKTVEEYYADELAILERAKKHE